MVEGNSVGQVKPQLAPEDATALALACWGVKVQTLKALPSYDDQNFYLGDGQGGEYVLKISCTDASLPSLQLQHSAQLRLAASGCPVPVPKELLPGVEQAGCSSITVHRTASGAQHYVRLLSYLAGSLLVDHQADNPVLMQALGAMAGRMDKILQGMDDPAAHREYWWDVKQVLLLRPHITAIKDPIKQIIVKKVLDAYEKEVVPRWGHMRSGLIHGDLNDCNVLVGADGASISGVLDFGDMISSHYANNVAVAMAYAMLGKADPVEMGGHVLEGYCRHLALSEAELSVLMVLVCARLVQSVVNSTLKMLQYPDDEYIAINQKPAWALLLRLWNDQRHQIARRWAVRALNVQ